jgi:hypothetical protein
MNALVKIDGYDGWTDEDETGLDTGSASAPRVFFTNDYRYALRDGVTELKKDTKEFAAPDVRRFACKWGLDRTRAPDRYPIAPGEKWPDLEARNEETPKEEWVVGPDGALKGPWVKESQVLLLDAETMQPFLFVTQTSGGLKAVSELAGQTKLMRQACGDHVSPIIVLKTTLWSKRFNRLRPFFQVQRYVEIGAKTRPAELSSPDSTAMKSADPAESIAQPAKPTLKEVAKPPLGKELSDTIKF